LTFKVYKLKFKAKTPISIGYHNLGFIQRTRYYIPGRAVWGAFTAAIARYIGSNTDGADQELYNEIGDEIKDNWRFTYFYPLINDEIKFPFIADDFKAMETSLIGSSGQTAIAASNGGAEEGSLHETEFINNIYKNKDDEEEYKYLKMIGYIFVPDNVNYKFNDKEFLYNYDDKIEIKLSKALKYITIGADSRYGYGWLELESITALDNDDKLFSKYSWLDDGSVELSAGEKTFAHLNREYKYLKNGILEPLVGREWASKNSGDKHQGAGQQLSKYEILYQPGATIKLQVGLDIEKIKFEIGKFGIWHHG